MSELTQFRKNKDHSFKHDPYSPIPHDERATFTGLNYYPENKALSFILEVEEFPQKEEIIMQTSTGDEALFLKFGRIHFPVHGAQQTLTLYESPGHGELFLPFGDATNSRETYGGGRYLEVYPVENGKYQVDFNLAYNPYCAYSDAWSCPIPPAENRLSVKIEAGEKKYK